MNAQASSEPQNLAGVVQRNIEALISRRQQEERGRKDFERVQQEQRQQIEALTRKLDEMTRSSVQTVAATNAPPPAPASAEQKKLEQELAAELAQSPATNATGAVSQQPSATSPVAKGWSPSQPITIMRAGSAYMNISFDALVDAGYSTEADPSQQLELGDHDPDTRGFSMRNAELALNGAVDPYFKGFGNIAFKLDNNNETELELEETYLLTTSLPYNLQAKAGQFFANFGRHNPQHPHQWAFVDAPLILTRTFGPDGLRNLGVQLSWLAPTPFYTELSLGILNGQGGTAYSFRNPGEPDPLGTERIHGRQTFDRSLAGPQDLLYVPRIASSFDITESQTLLLGTSGAFGPNETGPHNRTEIYGADIYWKWKAPNAREGFPFVSWQTEALYQRFGANADPTAPGGPLAGQNLRDYGFYSQALWGFVPRWVTGVRGEFVTGNQSAFDPNDPFRGERYRLSPVLTWYPSEFSKLRLQYNYDHGQYFGGAHSVWMQMEILLGAHGAHKF